MKPSNLSPVIKTIISVNCIAAVITVIFWLLVLVKLFIAPADEVGIKDGMKASTLGFLVADLIWAVPVLILSIPGLSKMNVWGWTTAQMANGLWLYSLTALWVRDVYSGSITPGDILFLPFLPFSIWSAYYLWVNRRKFGIG